MLPAAMHSYAFIPLNLMNIVFLMSGLMHSAVSRLQTRFFAQKTKKRHRCGKANPPKLDM